MRLMEASPPNIVLPSRERPCASEKERLDTPAIAATPMMIQAIKIPNPRRSPNKSRKAILRLRRNFERIPAVMRAYLI